MPDFRQAPPTMYVSLPLQATTLVSTSLAPPIGWGGGSYIQLIYNHLLQIMSYLKESIFPSELSKQDSVT